jgi:lipid-binding SYLF domain-containing protein
MRQRTSFLAALPLLVAAAVMAPAAYARDNYRAQDRIDDATGIVNQMKQDPNLTLLLDQARGVFIIPHYGKAGFIVGGQGGGGVVLVKHDGRWSDPAFYSIGGGSIGLQAGASGGSVAMLLMTPRAVRHFERDNNGKWSLSANAGLTLVTYNGGASVATGGDVVIWSDTRGLYAGLTAGVADITPDRHMDHEYYQAEVTPHDILSGAVAVHNPAVHDLRDALSKRVASR